MELLIWLGCGEGCRSADSLSLPTRLVAGGCILDEDMASLSGIDRFAESGKLEGRSVVISASIVMAVYMASNGGCVSTQARIEA